MENNMQKAAILSILSALLTCPAGAAIDISVTPNTPWNVGTGGPGEWTSPAPYVLKNNGESARVNIRAADSPNWRLAKTAGLNAFSMEWGTDPVWKNIYTNDSMMFASLAAGAQESFNFKYHSPTLISPLITTAQPSSVRFTAVSPYIGNWATATATNLSMQSYAMAAGIGGAIHVVYYDSGSQRLKYFKWDGQGQPVVHADIDPVALSINSDYDISFALDSSDNPHVMYKVDGILRYAKLNGTEWVRKDFNNDANYLPTMPGLFHSLVLDSNNNPHIAFPSGDSPSRVKYAVSADGGTNWVIQDVDEGGACSLKLDSAGEPHIAYSVSIANPIDVQNPDGLKYAKWNSETNQWDKSVVENGGRTGLDPELELDLKNRPFIGYYSEDVNGNPTSKLGKLDSNGYFGAEVVRSMAGRSALALNSSGYPIMVFDSNNQLEYYQWTGTEWLSSTLGTDVGSTPLLKLDSDGRAHVIYPDGNGGLKYLRWE